MGMNATVSLRAALIDAVHAPIFLLQEERMRRPTEARHLSDLPPETRRGGPGDAPAADPVADLPLIPLTPIPVTGRTGPRPGY